MGDFEPRDPCPNEGSIRHLEQSVPLEDTDVYRRRVDGSGNREERSVDASHLSEIRSWLGTRAQGVEGTGWVLGFRQEDAGRDV